MQVKKQRGDADERTAGRRRPGRPPKANAPGAVLDAAAVVFAEIGYDAATVEDVIGEAGIARATFYKHFGNKEDVLVELYRANDERVRQRVLGVVRSTDSITQMLESGVAEYLRAIVDEGPLARLFNGAPYRSEQLRQLRETSVKAYVAGITAALRAAGLEPPPALLLDAVLAAIDRIAVNLSEPGRGIPIDTPDAATFIPRLKEQLRNYGAHLLQSPSQPDHEWK
jgi:AcrR family transcriptional regulator